MIKGYRFKVINDEEILVLYLDYNYELGIDFKSRHKNSSMKKEIIEFIKKNKIKFNSGKIAISIGGIILAILLVTQNPNVSDDMLFTYVSDDIIYNEVEIMVPPTQDNQDNFIDDETNNNVIIDNKNEISNDNSTIDNNSSSQKPSTNVNSSNSSSSNNNSSTNNNSSDEIIDIPSNKEEDKESTINEMKVTVYRSNGSVITLSLEEYLIGVVGAEMPASFSIEALKAQAVISRTYALKKIESGGKLTDNEATQSYKDNNELKAIWGSSYDIYYNKIKTAVLDTEGQTIYYQGNLIDAVYHSTSNGKTEDAINVWGNSTPYLKSVDSSWDKEATSYLRSVSKDLNNVLTLLGIDLEEVSFEILSRNESGRVLEIKVGEQTYTGVEFRTLLGLRSADFDIEYNDNGVTIITRGYGHGVGMSQYGANGMAKNGYNYEQILKHYYTGVQIS